MAQLSKPWVSQDDAIQAKELYFELLPILKLLYSVSNPVPVKAAVNLLGFEVGNPRPPLPTFSGAKLTELNDKQADYIGVSKEGPFKDDTYRY